MRASSIKSLTKYSLPTIKLLMVQEPASKAKAISAPNDMNDLLSPLRYSPVEKFVIVLLDARHNPVAIHEVSQGTVSSSLAHPREVFKAAILSNASAIICAHNHPGGSTFASTDDIETTKQLIKAAEILGIPILDHVILTPQGEITSIRECYGHLWDK